MVSQMSYQWFIAIFEFCGYWLGYAIALAQVPTNFIQYMLQGQTFTWEVTNVMTGSNFLIEIPSYQALFDAIPLSAPDWLKENLVNFLTDICQFLGDAVYSVFVGVELSSAPLFLGLPIVAMRIAVMLFVFRLVGNIITTIKMYI